MTDKTLTDELAEALEAISEMLSARQDILARLEPLMGQAEKQVFEQARTALTKYRAAKAGDTSP